MTNSSKFGRNSAKSPVKSPAHRLVELLIGFSKEQLSAVARVSFTPSLFHKLLPTRSRCSVLSILLVCLPAVADENAEQPDTSDDRTVVSQVLAENLIRERDLEKRLQTVKVAADGLFAEGSVDTLQYLFGVPVDSFGLDVGRAEARSIRESAWNLLKNAPALAQRQWSKAVLPVAESEFNNAIASRDLRSIRLVSHRFPLTEPGIRAVVLAMTNDLLEGSIGEVQSELALQESRYSGTVLENEFRLVASPLRRKLESRLGAGPLAEQLVQASVEMSPRLGRISPPWPELKWQWTEAVWTYPGTPQPQAGTALESLIPDSSVTLNDFSDWKPVFWGEQIVHRSPFRLISFDRKTGQELWSLPTQTYRPESTVADGDDDGDALNSGSPLRLAEESGFLNGLAEFGLLSSDDDFLYFVDRFDFFPPMEDENNFRNRQGMLNPFGLRQNLQDSDEQSGTATRLVALRRAGPGGLPVVAWIAGNADGFSYQAVKSVPQPDKTAARSKDAKSPAGKGTDNEPAGDEPHRDDPMQAEEIQADAAPADSKRGEADGISATDDAPAQLSLNQHRFLGPPVGRHQRLFVMSIHREKVWLSCLARGNGSVIWQQPISFFNQMQEQLLDYTDAGHRASLCLLSGDVVICTLSSGILAAARAGDGQLLWATAIRDAETAPRFRAMRMPLDEDRNEESIRSPGVIVPFVSDGILVCTDTLSQMLNGVDVTTGKVIWSASRRAFGSGDIGGSPDFYIAGVSDDQVILIGERHCRSVNLKTGDQNWVVPVNRTTGRAECRNGRCLIPQIDGRVIAVNLEHGSIVPQRATFLPENAVRQYGAITSDDEILCMTTPVSLMVFARADTMLKENEVAQTDLPFRKEELLQVVQAHLIDGRDLQAVRILKSAVENASKSGDTDTASSLEGYLGELILRDWASRVLVINGSLPDDQVFSPGDSDSLDLLPELNLTSEQQLRAALLAMLSRPEKKLTADEITELSDFKEWKSPVPMTDEWKIRPDLLVQQTGNAIAANTTDFSKLTPIPLKRFAEEVVLFPEMLKSDKERQQLIHQLASNGNLALAEAIAVSWKKQSDSGESANVLSQIREINGIAGYIESEVREKFRPADAVKSGDVPRGVDSSVTSPIAVESEVFLGSPEWELQRTERGIAMSSLPDWVRLRYFLVDGSDGLPELVSMDLSDGSLRDSVPLPFGFHQNAVRYKPLSNNNETPGLLPIGGSEDLVMVSCGLPGKARILWTRRFRKRGEDDTPLEFGPMGANYMIWHYGEELHCSHPLTGRDLWTRKMRLSPVSRPLAGVRRIFGDDRSIAIMGTDVSSVERFRTRDGQATGSARLQISRISDAVTVGRCLLYSDSESRLHLFDAETGTDLLDDDEPILLGRYNPQSMCHVLSDGKVVTVSAAFEIILIDTNEGRILFRTPAASLVKTKVVFGLTAFERHGKLFVGLEEQRDFMIRTVESQFRPYEPRVYAGPLVCLDPQSGKIQWSLPLQSTAIPEVFGDPTDLMLMWSSPPLTEDQAFEQRGQTINLQLVNERTGEVVLKEKSLSTSRPVRCSHSAVNRTIELVSKDSRIMLKAESADSEGRVQPE